MSTHKSLTPTPKVEPDESDRYLSKERQPMSYEVVERGPAARASMGLGTAAGSRPVIEDPDRELVLRWQGGDDSAFEVLVERHQRRVFRLLMRMMGTREEAEDVSQETFLSLHRHGKRFRSEARFSTFVYRVAANAALNRRRSLGRARARTERFAVRQAGGDNLPYSPRDPEDAALGNELSQRVRDALQTLTPSLRMPVVLYDIEGLAYGEIAEILGVAEGTIKSRIHRARKALREELRVALGKSGEGNTL
ncbi:MAG: sigma-70 family RNA polymerase sigma factor [Deltaproteobacteria bacterium]|nr:sigma-70 family RNA polymerase sigma factor [Deltaproteobacteria bacterium]